MKTSPLRCLIFRGSIPHPMQSLCTLRTTVAVATRRFATKRTLTPTWAGLPPWIAPALPGAQLVRLVGAGDERFNIFASLGVQVVRRPQRQTYRRRSRKAFIPNKAAGVRLATRESSFCLAIRRDPSVTSKASAGMPRATKNSQWSEPCPTSGSGPL